MEFNLTMLLPLLDMVEKDLTNTTSLKIPGVALGEIQATSKSMLEVSKLIPMVSAEFKWIPTFHPLTDQCQFGN